jgi:hypothetical protein
MSGRAGSMLTVSGSELHGVCLKELWQLTNIKSQRFTTCADTVTSAMC